jgi:hypothetical protein
VELGGKVLVPALKKIVIHFIRTARNLQWDLNQQTGLPGYNVEVKS